MIFIISYEVSETDKNKKTIVKISHLLKVREGCGMGGSRKSISIVHSFIAKLVIKYLIL